MQRVQCKSLTFTIISLLRLLLVDVLVLLPVYLNIRRTFAGYYHMRLALLRLSAQRQRTIHEDYFFI
jgi:hypothetical protein